MNKYQKAGIILSLVTCSLLADPSIKVDPAIENFVPQNRIVLKANIEDKSGVEVVRAYFKEGDVSTFAFVPMNCEKDLCLATLPAPSKDTKTLDYAILVKNGENKVFKSQTFTATATKKGDKLPAYQSADKTNTLHVKTELANAPKAITGFSDNLTVDVVESAAKFGVVAGMYSASQAGTTIAGASAASGATAAGTVVATTAGISTMAIVGGVVAVAGGAAAAGGGGGGSSSTTTTNPEITNPIISSTAVNLAGTWNTTKVWDGCTVNNTFNVNESNGNIVEVCSSGDYFIYNGNNRCAGVGSNSTPICEGVSPIPNPAEENEFVVSGNIAVINNTLASGCSVTTYTDTLIQGTCNVPSGGPVTFTLRK